MGIIIARSLAGFVRLFKIVNDDKRVFVANTTPATSVKMWQFDACFL